MDNDNEVHSLNQSLRRVGPALLVAAGAIACQAPQHDPVRANATEQSAPIQQADQAASGKDWGKNVTNESAPINQRFRSLDEYLAWLERTQGPVDGPWYKQVSPGVYELQTGNLRIHGGEQEKRRFTRQELADMFGFAN